jgi:hypothetical protein
MHREYAVDPQSLTDIGSLVALIQSFENHPERLVADCPKKWANDVLSAITALKHQDVMPIQRHSLKEKLRKLVHENLCRNRRTDIWHRNAETWLSYAEREHMAKPFDAILSDGKPTIATGVTYPIKGLWMNAPVCWTQARQQHVNRTASQIVSMALPLLRVSKRVMLVDPYFCFTYPNWGNYKPLLVELINRLVGFPGVSTVRAIEIHTSNRYGGLQALMDKEVLPLLPRDFKVVCKSWPQSEMHDRFILTDVGGLFLGHGLGVFQLDGGHQVLVSALERETLKRELSKLDKPSSESAEVEK